MDITITAQEDWEGQIREIIPSGSLINATSFKSTDKADILTTSTSL